MSHPIKVSVIIPVYRVEAYLERAVESVLAQTLEEKEIVLVDDGSDDASPAICDRYAQTYPELVRVIHQENQGLGMARNAGVRIAVGDYVAFLDSDDTVEPEMYARMYEKAVEEDCDIVMCDVRILYVEENRSSVSVTYPKAEIDPSDYIATGNNITYSVNKLFRRSIWEDAQYERMVFEDIALIPSLVTRYPRIGYVPQPFYNYYRRAHTLSTTQAGEMVDIVKAFRRFLDTSDPAYREEVVYCAAKQIYWNMFQSRPLFQADFIELLQEYRADFLLNPYVDRDSKIRKILPYLDQTVIPESFICVHFGRPIPDAYCEQLAAHFPAAALIDIAQPPEPDTLPPSVREALAAGNLAYVEEYCALRVLYERGGIILSPDMRARLPLKKLRLQPIFFGFENDEELETGCMGAIPGYYVIQALLKTYEIPSIFNQAQLPLKERLRDFLILHFQLKANGRKQLLKKHIPIYLPSVLSYDMQDGENCCKRAEPPAPEGYQLVSDRVLKMWSDRILENWNLYKQELHKKPAAGGKSGLPASAAPPPSPEWYAKELDQQIREVVNTYETSTSWKITKPIRALGSWMKTIRARAGRGRRGGTR